MAAIYADYVQDGDILPTLDEHDAVFHFPQDPQSSVNDVAFENNADEDNQRTCIQQPPIPQIDDVEVSQRILVSDVSRSLVQTIPEGHKLEVERLCFAAGIPEMPKTSIEGIAFIVPIEVLQKSEVEKPWDILQYQIRRRQPGYATTTALFGDVPVVRHTYNCTGGKACPYMPVQSFRHTEITVDLEARIARLREQIKQVNCRTKAIGQVKEVHKRFKKKKACCNQEDTCELRLSTTEYGAISGIRQYILCCSKGMTTTSSHGHFFYPIPVEFHEHLELITKIVLNEDYCPENESENICHMFSSNRRQRTTCDEVHLGKSPDIIQITCDVVYRFFIPKNREATPYILITSHGEHLHPPPPATKTPRSIVDSIFSIVRQINQPSTSLNAFLTSKELKQFLVENKGRSIIDIHRSLANTDYLRHIIRKQQILLFPAGGQGIALSLLQTNERNKKTCYIQHAVQSYSNYMIICFHHEQAKQWNLTGLTSFMVDANYKHVKGAYHREIIWAWYSHNSEKALPLARCFTNSESADMYQYMFRQVFYILENKYNIIVKWKYVDREGLLGVTTDQSLSVIQGLGEYLRTKYPIEKPLEYHVASTTRLCHVHFERGVKHILGDNCPTAEGSLYNIFMSLLTCNIPHEYDAICDEIAERWPRYAGWARHKRSPLIAAGFCQAKSNISSNDWHQIPKHTNTVEIMHVSSYRWTGRYLPLVQIIDGVRDQDWNLISRDQATRILQIPSTYRNTSVNGRFDLVLQKRKRRQIERRDDMLDEEAARTRIRRRNVSGPIENRQRSRASSVDSVASNQSEPDLFNIRDGSEDPAFQRANTVSSSGVPSQMQRGLPRNRTPISSSQGLYRQVVYNQTSVQQNQLVFEEQQLYLEQRRRELERQSNEASLELEIRRRAAEAAEQRKAFEVEQRIQLERERMQMELQFRFR